MFIFNFKLKDPQGFLKNSCFIVLESLKTTFNRCYIAFEICTPPRPFYSLPPPTPLVLSRRDNFFNNLYLLISLLTKESFSNINSNIVLALNSVASSLLRFSIASLIGFIASSKPFKASKSILLAFIG